MAKYEAKTKPSAVSVDAFLAGLESSRQSDANALCAMMEVITGEKPVLWGPSIVGFGSYAYRYESGHGGTSMLTGFSPRKAALSVYISSGFDEREGLLQRLGPHSTGKACLYIKKLADVDQGVLRQLIADSVAEMRRRHPAV